MDQVQFVRDQLGPRVKSEIFRVAREAGIPATTVYAIAKGWTKNPRVHTLAPIVAVLKREARHAQAAN